MVFLKKKFFETSTATLSFHMTPCTPLASVVWFLCITYTTATKLHLTPSSPAVGYDLPIPGASWHNTHSTSHGPVRVTDKKRQTKGRASRHSACSCIMCKHLQHIPGLATGRGSVRKSSKAVPFPLPAEQQLFCSLKLNTFHLTR